MRNFLTAVALAATMIIAGNAMAQEQFWWTTSSGNSDSGNFDDLGIGSGTLRLNGTDQSIDNLYLEGNPASIENNTGTTTSVNTFYVTPDSIEYRDKFTGDGATIQNFTLYVGDPIPVAEGFFGAPSTSKSIVMSETAINGVTDSFGSWQINGEKKVVNDGSIYQLTYYGGKYEGTGTIEHLVVGTNMVGSKITAATSVSFDGNGEGLYLVSGTGAYDSVTYDASNLPLVGEGGINFANAQIQLNLGSSTPEGMTFAEWVGTTDGIGNIFTFDFADVLGIDDDLISGIWDAEAGTSALADFGIWWGASNELMSIFNEDRTIAEGWAMGANYVSYQAPNAAPAPEPATLAVLGLGLAGLGMASRRRRK